MTISKRATAARGIQNTMRFQNIAKQNKSCRYHRIYSYLAENGRAVSCMSLSVELHQLHVSPVRHACRHFAGNVENGSLFREEVLCGTDLTSKTRSGTSQKCAPQNHEGGRSHVYPSHLSLRVAERFRGPHYMKLQPFRAISVSKLPCPVGGTPARNLALATPNTNKHQRSCLLDVVELLQQLAEVIACFCPGSLHKPGKLCQVALCSRSRPSPGFDLRPPLARLPFVFSLSLQLHPQLSKRFRASCRFLLWLCDDISRKGVHTSKGERLCTGYIETMACHQ